MGDMAIAVSPAAGAVSEPAPHRVTVDEFHRMWDADVFGDVRIELVDGVLIDVPPSQPPHGGNVAAFVHVFGRRFGERVQVRPQLALPVSRFSEPEPDLALVAWDANFYRDRHPSPEETFAIVEVSYSSLAFDRKTKKRVYGAAGIAEYWIVDVRGEAIEMHRSPHEAGYGDRSIAKRGDTVAFAAFGDIVFTVDELLG